MWLAERAGINRTLVVAGVRRNLRHNGELDLSNATWRPVKRFIRHPEYISTYSPADIGLIEIADPPFDLGRRTNIYPACLLMKSIDLADYGLLLITKQSQSLYLPVEMKELATKREENGLHHVYVEQQKNESTPCDRSLICYSSNSTELCETDNGR